MEGTNTGVNTAESDLHQTRVDAGYKATLKST
jgi:hypothetical protein